MFLKKQHRMRIIILLLFCLILFCMFYNNNKYFLENFEQPSYINGVCYQTSFAKSTSGKPLGSQFMSDIGIDINWNGLNGMRNKQISTNSGNKNVLEFLRDNNVNCIRTYNATLDYPHKQFFKDLEQNGLRVMYPINNYFCYVLKNHDNDDVNLKIFLNKMIQETKEGSDYRPAIHSFAFGNEGELAAEDKSIGRYQKYPANSWATRLIEVIDIFVNIEKENNINSKIDIVIPLSFAFAPNHGQFKMLSNLVDNKPWKERFVLGINAFNDCQTIKTQMKRYNKPFYITEYSPPPHSSNSSLFESELKKLWEYHNEEKKLKGVFAFSFLSQVTKKGDEKNYDITRYQDSKYNIEKCENILDGEGNFAELGNPQCPPQTAVIKDHNNKFEGISNAFKSYTIPRPKPSTQKYNCNNGTCEKSINGQYISFSECELNCKKGPGPTPGPKLTNCTAKNGNTIKVDFSENACGNNLTGGFNHQYLCYVEGDRNCGSQKKDECVNAGFHWCGPSD